jgi:hypothetical protein
MAIRKSLASFLSATAARLERDESKEKVGETIKAVRIALANAIMPKVPPAHY